jgi:hypothetical protein
MSISLVLQLYGYAKAAGTTSRELRYHRDAPGMEQKNSSISTDSALLRGDINKCNSEYPVGARERPELWKPALNGCSDLEGTTFKFGV